MRYGMIASFQFSCDISEDVFEGVTLNVSENGLGFLTEVALKEGQVITIIKHDIPDIAGRQATVSWAEKGIRHYHVGARFIS